MGLFSSSSSRSSTTNNNRDQRIVADAGSIGVSGDSNTVNVLDGGAINRTFDSFDLVNKTQAEGLGALLSTAEKFFTKTTDAATTMAGTVEKSVLDAYRNAASDKTSTIDNRTIVVIAIVGAALVFFVTRKR